MVDRKPEPRIDQTPVDERMGYVSPQRYEDISNQTGGGDGGQEQQQSNGAPEEK